MRSIFEDDSNLCARCRYIAYASVFGSTVRNQGCTSVTDVRRRLSEIDVSPLRNIENEETFQSWLDEKTDIIINLFNFKNGIRNWGAPRKILNIYLFALSRDYVTRETMKMDKIESFLEAPLDNKMIDFIFCKAEKEERSTLGARYRFRIKRLSKDDSDRFQKVAKGIAERKGLKRVELDFIAWTNPL